MRFSALHHVSSSFRSHFNVHWAARVRPLEFRDRRSHDFVEDDVLQRGDQRTMRHRGAWKLAVQQVLWHQLPDCKRLLHISEFGEPALGLVGLNGERLRMSSTCSTSLARSLSLMSTPF